MPSEPSVFDILRVINKEALTAAETLLSCPRLDSYKDKNPIAYIQQRLGAMQAILEAKRT